MHRLSSLQLHHPTFHAKTVIPAIVCAGKGNAAPSLGQAHHPRHPGLQEGSGVPMALVQLAAHVPGRGAGEGRKAQLPGVD